MATTESSAPAHPPTTEKTPRSCAACGEPSGSNSAGTGKPLVGRKGGPKYHVKCKPGRALAAVLAAL